MWIISIARSPIEGSNGLPPERFISGPARNDGEEPRAELKFQHRRRILRK